MDLRKILLESFALPTSNPNPGSLAVDLGANTTATQMVGSSDKDVVMLQLGLTAPATGNVKITAITFHASGTGDDMTAISNVRLYRDDDNDGILSSIDMRIGTTTAFFVCDNGSVTLYTSYYAPCEIIPAGSTVNWIVVYNFTGTANAGDSFVCSLTW